jgi:putative transposase
MAQGFVYLVAVMDWYSRFVLSWALSVTMELPFWYLFTDLTDL